MPPQILRAGPWKGVLDTPDPFDDQENPSLLQDATNLYFLDPQGSTGAFARPGFAASGATISSTAGQAACLYTMTALDGTIYRFLITNGKLYRLTGTGYSTATDVTPVGITIDASASPARRIYMKAFADELIVTDGVNRPWRGTNLSSTPITGTYIDIDGAAGSWSAQGEPQVYAGTLFFIARTVPVGSSVEAGVGMVWSEPFQPDIGYVQTTYANFWNLVEQVADPLYALWATNNYLYYFRERSIGAISGAPGVNFSTTASADMVAVNVGCTAPASICQFGDTIYFVDAIGRPHSFTADTTPRELWRQMRGQIEGTNVLSYPASTALRAVSVVVPQLNVVLMGGWAYDPSSTNLGPLTLYCFDGQSGQYYGRWNGAATSGLTNIDALAQMKTSTGAATIGIYTTGTTKPVFLLSLLGDANWKDNTVVVSRSIQTFRLGYSSRQVWSAADTGTVIVQDSAPLTITVRTPYTASTVEATAKSPASSQDGTYRVIFGMDVRSARGIQLTIAPTTATAQWVCQQVSFPATASKAGIEEQ